MGNAVAPAPAAETALNNALSSTAELDACTVPRPSISSSPTPAAPPAVERPASKQNNYTGEEKEQPEAVAVDMSAALQLQGMSAQQRLFFAASNGRCDLLRQAVQDGAKVNAVDVGLKEEEEQKRQQEEKDGVKRRPSKKEKDDDELYRNLTVTRESALHKAAAKGHVPAVELLFYLEADLEAKDVLGSTPLHRAVSCKQQAVVSLLLSKGSNLEAVNAIGNSALHIAAYQGETEMAQLLFAHDRRHCWKLVVAVNHAGLTPIDYARKKAMHALLTAHRLGPSHNPSFTGHQLAFTAAGTPLAPSTPKHDTAALSSYPSTPAEAGEEKPPLGRAASGGSGGGGGSGGRMGSRRSSDAAASHASGHHHHHHHAPNPPVSSNGVSGQHALRSLRSSQSSEQPSAEQPSAQPLAPLVRGGSQAALWSASASAQSTFSASSASAVLQPAADSPSHSHPVLISKPSLDKTASLESQSAATTAPEADWKGRGLSTGGLSLNLLTRGDSVDSGGSGDSQVQLLAGQRDSAGEQEQLQAH